MKRTAIVLTGEERQTLEQFSRTGVHSVRLVNRAGIILALDQSEGRKAMKQKEIVQHLGVTRQTVNRAKRDFLAAENTAAFLQRKKRVRPPVLPKVTGELEARIIALACGKAPEGRARWTLHLLADKCIELHYADTISYRTVSRVLKKQNLSLT